uniref:Uncharacterized protein n=1 Tax=Anguilla anguilla TaxID=7936 RepID=A0A0E9RBI0_ANGAN
MFDKKYLHKRATVLGNITTGNAAHLRQNS